MGDTWKPTDPGRAGAGRFPVWLAVLAVCAGLASPAAAGTIWDRVTETILPNGLKVLLIEEPKAPVVTVQIWYKAGARNEPLGKGGLAHMMEHMMFKGTPKTGPKQFSIIVQRNGGQDNAHTARDAAAYYTDFAADRVNLGLELEADRMVNVLFEEKEFLPERDVVYEERRLRFEDQPSATLGEVMRATSFMAHPYGRPTIGWPSEIKGWTLQDAKQFYQTYYAPNTATLIVAGDIKKDEVLKKITELFGSIPRGPEPPPMVIPQEPPQIGERRVFVRKEAELPIFFAVHHVPNLTHADSAALNVLAYVLGGGRAPGSTRRSSTSCNWPPTPGRTTTRCTRIPICSASAPAPCRARRRKRSSAPWWPRWSASSKSRSPTGNCRKPRTRSRPSLFSPRTRSTRWPISWVRTSRRRAGSS